MKFVYVADSEGLVPYAMSAVLIDEKDWRATYDLFAAFRKNMKTEASLDPASPLCILPLASGTGTGSLAPGRGRNVLSSLAQLLSALPVTIVSVASHSGGDQRAALRKRAFPIAMQRIERASAMGDGFRFTVVCDGGMEGDIRSLSRKLRKYNPLPGGLNVPMTELIEDSFVREQNTSHLLKSAEFAAFLVRAFSLLKNEDAETGFLSEYAELDKKFVFRIFSLWSERGILMERASMSNKYGIVTIR